LGFDFGTVGQYGRVGAMLAADPNKFHIIKLAEFEQDVVDGRVSVASQEYGLFKQDGQSYQSHNERSLSSAR
jgi:hypothetical protein